MSESTIWKMLVLMSAPPASANPPNAKNAACTG